MHFPRIRIARFEQIHPNISIAQPSGGGVAKKLFFDVIKKGIQEHSGKLGEIPTSYIRWTEKSNIFLNHPLRWPFLIYPKTFISCEMGWLPRSSWQISNRGSNQRSHIKFCPSTDYLGLIGGKSNLDRMVSHIIKRFSLGSLKTSVPESYFVVPLQIANDYNLRYSNSKFTEYYYSRKNNANTLFAQKVINHVETLYPDTPIIFMQHPADNDRNDIRCKYRHNQYIKSDESVRTIDLVSQEGCKGVISVNSNMLHEALLLKKPVRALSHLLWEPDKDPISELFPKRYDENIRLQYLSMIFCYQWYPEDFQSAEMLRALLSDLRYLIPSKERFKATGSYLPETMLAAANRVNKINGGDYFFDR